MRAALVVLTAALLVPAAAAAPPLPDPTQPPGARSAQASPRPAAPRASAPTVRPRVTSILIPQRGEASAWVDGRLLRVGERLPGGETLAHIDAHGITLQGPRGEQRLQLLADVAMPSRAAMADAVPIPPAVELAERSKP